MVKRIFALTLTAVSLLLLSSCGENKEPNRAHTSETETVSETAENTETTLSDILSTSANVTEAIEEKTEPVKTTASTTNQNKETENLGPLFQKYIVDAVSDGSYTMKFKQSGVSLVTTVDGSNSVIESNASGVIQITLICKDGKYYMLVPTTKKYVEMSADDFADQASSFENISLSFDGIKLTDSGEETVKGVRYKTEIYNEGNRGEVTYYFTDDGLKRLKTVKDGETNVIETFEISSNIDKSVFDIPSNFKEVSDPSQVMLP